MTMYSHRLKFHHPDDVRGTSLIEVLMSILILTVGMLGLAALQGKANTAELESYQRGQALILLQDIVDRIENNTTTQAQFYVTPAPLGTGATDLAPCAGTRAAIDLCEWSKALKGASETKGTVRQGAMIDGRGCVEELTAGREYKVSVVWQGVGKTAAPSSITACGQNLYDSEDTRRAITTIVRIPDLAAS